ncbi:MAG: hypothetical protein ACRD9R_04430 [Pyrinomonadaceae bacterium]
MFSTTEEKKEELSSRFRVREVVLKWFFGEAKFSREEFLALFDVHEHVAEVLNKAFVEKYVVHLDLRKEDPEDCIASLMKVSEYLDSKIRELRGKLPPPQRGILRILEQIRSASVEHGKLLYSRNKEMEEGNLGEFESEYHIRFADWVMEPLREFRLAVYPHFRVLIDLLPADHPAKERAEDKWYEGRALLTEKQKDLALPRWKLLE